MLPIETRKDTTIWKIPQIYKRIPWHRVHITPDRSSQIGYPELEIRVSRLYPDKNMLNHSINSVNIATK